ncbi:ATP-binding protein [Hydrogenophaga sp.]|uniref:ATP-binding protein n=1 Tax=Hydrogenophaga sp. TaxID=1904254 RepID=UPI002FCB09B1
MGRNSFMFGNKGMKQGMLLVCVMADGQALQLVRHACQLQQARAGSWRVLHLDTVSARYASQAVKRDLEQALQLAHVEGAQIVHSNLNLNASGHLMAQIVQQAQGAMVSDVLLGDQATGTVYWPGSGERLSDFTALLGASLPSAQVHVLVAQPRQIRSSGQGAGWTSRPPTIRSWRYWSLPLAILLVCTALGALIADHLHPINLILIYLVGVLYVALQRDLVASVLTVLCAILIFDWIFVEPRWSLKPADPEYFFTFAIALCVGLAVSRLATRARAAAATALALADRAQSLSLMAQSLSTARTPDEIERTLLHAVERGVGAKGRLTLGAVMAPEAPLHPVLPAPDGTYRFGLDATHGPLGVLHVEQLPAERQTAEDLHFLQALSNQAAIALDRCNADLRSQQAAIQAETERVRNTLLAGISHDFRTPLTTIIGAATTVLTQGRQITPEQHEALLRNLLDQAQRLQSLTSDLLDLARLQDGAVRPECEWCPVGELVRDALALVHGGSEAGRVDVLANEDDIVWCDPRLITQAMSNLLINAVQHSPPQGRIGVEVRLGPDDWALSVRDQGLGLLPGQEVEVFRKFHRDASAGSTSGTGLGLAICEVVARLHGGQVSARSDGGAVFELRIPWPANEPRPLDLSE